MNMVDLGIFINSALRFLHGQSPYVAGFYNPPWLLAVMVPLALMPLRWAKIVWYIVSVVLFWTVARRYAKSKWDALAFMLCFPTLSSVEQGNLEALVMLGLLLPASWGNLFLALKPQIAIGALLYNLKHGWKTTIPLGVATIASLAIFGLWPLHLLGARAFTASWNMAYWWPYLVPLGVWLVWKGIVTDNILLCIAASVFLSPYLGPTSLCVVWLPLLRVKHASVILTVVTWGLILVQLRGRML